MSLCRTSWCGAGVGSERRRKEASLLASLWSAEPTGFAVTCFVLGSQPRHRDDLQREQGSRALITMGKEEQQGCKGFAFPVQLVLWPSPCDLLPHVLCGAALQWSLLHRSLSTRMDGGPPPSPYVDSSDRLAKLFVTIGFLLQVFFFVPQMFYKIKWLLRQNLENKQQVDYNLQYC